MGFMQRIQAPAPQAVRPVRPEPEKTSPLRAPSGAIPLLARDDPRERGAERIASEVLSRPLSATETHRPPPPRATGRAGAPLDAAARAYFEPRFGRDFAAVRVHAGEGAAAAARSLGAAAFTVGADIGFAAGLYSPATAKGRALLAHELAHVAQQAAGPPAVARQPVEQYETKAVGFDPLELGNESEFGYWEQKLGTIFYLAKDARLEADPEERDAVLSVVWQIRPPSPVTGETRRVVSVRKRPKAAASQDLVYQVNFKPRPSPAERDIVEVIFVAAGAGAVPLTPDAPSTSFTRSAGYTPVDFPQRDVAGYWRAHPDEERRVFSWVETRAGDKFDQVIDTGSATFKVTGSKEPSGRVTDLTVTFLGAASLSAQTPPPGYQAHDFADRHIDEARSTGDPADGGKLGAIKWLDKAPAAELPSVKHSIWQYFRSGARNAEVDAIVPIAGTVTTEPRSQLARDTAREFARIGIPLDPKRVLYTFRFRPNAKDSKITDVDVQRIGERGKEVSLAPQDALGLAHVNGYADHAKTDAQGHEDIATLKGWLATRYQGVTPAGADFAAIEKDVTAKIRAGSGEPGWFRTNYGIEVLNETEAAEWLKSNVDKAPEALRDLRSFSKTELQVLELVLERISDKIVQTFNGVRLIRQQIYNKWIGPPEFPKPGHFEPRPVIGGVTIQGKTRTIIIFDHAGVNAGDLFLGGKSGVEIATAQPFAHELGHTVEKLPGLRKKETIQQDFDRLVAAKIIKPITWYAASDPPKELFAESFGLYYTDPEWLQQNWPDLYRFFDHLDKTGMPPPP